jgi:bacillithiol biosynthesis cysteine-adding enzyme BshC
VTGQQAGVFGGPLYTFYKIITTLKLVEKLSKKCPDSSFLPIFWMEVDDNDFEEINHILYFNKQGELIRQEISANEEDELKPVYKRRIPAIISEWSGKLQDEMIHTEFMTPVLDSFLSAYSEGQNYSHAFAFLLQKFFGKYGLIILNPFNSNFKKLAAPVFKKALRYPQELLNVFQEKTEAIKNLNLPAQIETREKQTLLFLLDDNDRRIRIDFETDGRYYVKSPQENLILNIEQLHQILKTSPERFSPNVALRPVVQDYVLPTIAYVAGPAEISYFAQISSFYDYFDLQMPVIYPRHRVTILENKINRIINKHDINLSELYKHRADFADFFIKNESSQTIFDKIQSVENEIESQLKLLEKIILEFDLTLINPLKKSDQKIKSTLQQLMGKTTQSFKEKEKVKVGQIEKVIEQLFPQNNFQERSLNMIYFLVKYGPDFVNQLYQALPSETAEHFIVRI